MQASPDPPNQACHVGIFGAIHHPGELDPRLGETGRELDRMQCCPGRRYPMPFPECIVDVIGELGLIALGVINNLHQFCEDLHVVV